MNQIVRLIVSLSILELLFVLLQARWPGRPGQGVRRAGLTSDLLFWFCTPLLTRPLTMAVTALVVLPVLILGGSVRTGYHGFGPIAQLPPWVEAVAMLIVGDFTGYWVHRWFHGKMLWPFHAVHHSSTELDWLSSTRLHPVNDALQRLVQAMPLVLLGFAPGALAAYLPFLTFYGILIHANLSWDFGPLRLVFTSPTFHRWHHSAEPEARDKNFAGLLPVWDLLFGTLYLPVGHRPSRFGVADGEMPGAFLGLMVYPFRRRAPTIPAA